MARAPKNKKVYIQGLDGLLEQLGGLKEVEKHMQAGRTKAAEIVQSAIEAEAPQGPTGNLKRSIEINPKTLSKRPPLVEFVATNHKIAPHAHLVEFGARGGKMPANSFFSRGFLKSRSAAREALAADVPRAIDKAL